MSGLPCVCKPSSIKFPLVCQRRTAGQAVSTQALAATLRLHPSPQDELPSPASLQHKGLSMQVVKEQKSV